MATEPQVSRPRGRPKFPLWMKPLNKQVKLATESELSNEAQLKHLGTALKRAQMEGATQAELIELLVKHGLKVTVKKLADIISKAPDEEPEVDAGQRRYRVEYDKTVSVEEVEAAVAKFKKTMARVSNTKVSHMQMLHLAYPELDRLRQMRVEIPALVEMLAEYGVLIKERSLSTALSRIRTKREQLAR